MARSQANIQFSIWEGLKGASPMAKLVYHRLLTEETMTQCGVGALLVDQFADDLELPLELVNELLDELEAKRYAYVDRDAHRFLVRTLIRRDGIANVPNVLWAAVRAAKMVRSKKLRRVLAAELRKLPPKPPDKVTPVPGKPDRIYVYPDPHATADEIDPGPEYDGPPPAREPLPAVNGQHPSPIPSPSDTASHRDPISAQPQEAAAAMDSASHPASTGGGGGGGGGGKPPVGYNSSSESALRAPRARTHAYAREDEPVANVIEMPGLFPVEVVVDSPRVEVEALDVAEQPDMIDPPPGWKPEPRDLKRKPTAKRTPQELNGTVRRPPGQALVHAWADTQQGPPPPVQVTNRLAIGATALLEQGWTAAQVSAALEYWSTKAVGPHALPAVADEWRRMQNRPRAEERPARSTLARQSVDDAFRRWTPPVIGIPRTAHGG